MALDPRPVASKDAAAFVRAVEVAFGNVADDEEVAHWCDFFDPDFALAVHDGGRIVATASANLFEFTLPAGGGQACPAITVPGVTAVGVSPTHRRRGLLTKLMTRQLSDYRERGYPLAILTASESVIYGRFGYGLSQSFQSVAIDRRRAGFARAVVATGRLRMLDRDDAGKILPELHDRARRLRPGEISRPPQWWDWHFKDPEKHRDGGEGRLYVVHESGRGEADGYVSYRHHGRWPDGIAADRVEITDLVALTPGVHAELWRFVLDLDLVGEVRASSRPFDDPLRWLLTDPRQLRTTGVGDHVWTRLIDVPSALEARGYEANERLVLEVSSADPTSAGRFVLETGPTSASCRKARKGEKADLVLGLADLGALYLGGLRPSTLAAAGRVVESRPGALATADAVFVSRVAPFCSTGF